MVKMSGGYILVDASNVNFDIAVNGSVNIQLEDKDYNKAIFGKPLLLKFRCNDDDESVIMDLCGFVGARNTFEDNEYSDSIYIYGEIIKQLNENGREIWMSINNKTKVLTVNISGN